MEEKKSFLPTSLQPTDLWILGLYYIFIILNLLCYLHISNFNDLCLSIDYRFSTALQPLSSAVEYNKNVVPLCHGKKMALGFWAVYLGLLFSFFLKKSIFTLCNMLIMWRNMKTIWAPSVVKLYPQVCLKKSWPTIKYKTHIINSIIK